MSSGTVTSLFGIGWTATPDSTALDGTQQIQIQVSFACTPGSGVGTQDIVTAVNQLMPNASLTNVTESPFDYINIFNWASFNFTIQMMPPAGIQVGTVRQALSQLGQYVNNNKIMPCSNFVIGEIDLYTGGSNPYLPFSNALSDIGQNLVTSLTLVVILVLVGLYLFNKYL